MKKNGIGLTYSDSLCFLKKRECSTGIVAAVVSRDSLQHGGRGFVAGGDLPDSAASGLLRAPPAPSVLLI